MTQLSVPGRPRGCYRLRLADGRIFKYRRMPTAQRAEMVERLTDLIDSPHIPRVLDRCGTGLLIEFVNARTLRRDDLTPKFIAEAASLQGRIHEMDVSDLLSEEPPPDAKKRASRLRASIGRLVSHHSLARREGDGLLELALSYAPRAIDSGLTHNDFCSQNILLTPGGNLVVVDNETVGIGPYEFDLARTWYLWPMKPSERAAYWESYSRHRDPVDFAASSLFWIIDVMVRSTLFRLKGRSPRAAIPLRKLRLILRGSGSDTPEPHLF